MSIRHVVLGLFALTAMLGATSCADTYGSRRDTDVRAEVSAHYSSDVDYDYLAPYGTWVAVSYGWAWCPLDVSAGWRPYTIGRWAYTDYGWMWISDDPWGSVPYHYGRWAFDDLYGWVWIPGDVWAPAWVSWRYGGDWIGWAPLPPDLGWQVGVGFQYSSIDIDRRIDPQTWCFTSASGFQSARVSERVAPVGRNATLLSVTENVTRYEDSRSVPAERGLRPDWISRASGRSVPHYQVVDAASPSMGKRPVLRGREIAVYRTRPENRAGGDDRLRADPPQRYRTSPSRRLVERQRGEVQSVSRRLSEERAELDRIQERERRQPPEGVSQQELQRRHQAERRAQDTREERVRRSYEKRQEKFENRGQIESRGDEERGRRDREREKRPGRRGSSG